MGPANAAAVAERARFALQEVARAQPRPTALYSGEWKSTQHCTDPYMNADEIVRGCGKAPGTSSMSYFVHGLPITFSIRGVSHRPWVMGQHLEFRDPITIEMRRSRIEGHRQLVGLPWRIFTHRRACLWNARLERALSFGQHQLVTTSQLVKVSCTRNWIFSGCSGLTV